MIYKFRGKSLQTNEWLKGDLVHVNGKPFIVDPKLNWLDIFAGLSRFIMNDFEVHPDSVGMWTGMRDKNKTEIFSGDTLIDIEDEDGYYLVGYNQEKLQFVFSFYAEACHLDQSGGDSPSGCIKKFEEYSVDDLPLSEIQIIGNKFDTDNPKLLDKKT